MKNGKLVISLDFELHWGAAEIWDLKKKKNYFDVTRSSISPLLKLFEKYEIHATWATVGFLFAESKIELLEFSPPNKPSYVNTKLNYYSLIPTEQVGENESDDPYHFAKSLITKINKSPNQELASHTFSHYYCNEKGQTPDQFRADIFAAQAIAKTKFDLRFKSLVLPRNQLNLKYIGLARSAGFRIIRSNPNVWFWNQRNRLTPLFRALDSLISISKPLTFREDELEFKEGVLLLPASRFLRPYTVKERFIQRLKIVRIKKEMLHAAKNNRVYHLWWHPHNFGYSNEKNLQFLEELLIYFKILKNKYNFQSLNMQEFLQNIDSR